MRQRSSSILSRRRHCLLSCRLSRSSALLCSAILPDRAPLSLSLPLSAPPPLSLSSSVLLVIMANPNVQKVPKLMLQFNDWQAAGKIDKQQNNQMNSQHTNQKTECEADTPHRATAHAEERNEAAKSPRWCMSGGSGESGQLPLTPPCKLVRSSVLILTCCVLCCYSFRFGSVVPSRDSRVGG